MIEELTKLRRNINISPLTAIAQSSIKHQAITHHQPQSTSSMMTKNNATSALPKKQINLLRGWPNASLLPTQAIQDAANKVLSNPDIANPALLYGPDPGPVSLRESVAAWLQDFYSEYHPPPRDKKENIAPSRDNQGTENSPEADRICITGGASQNLACILQTYSDAKVTRVWMVTPGYFLAGRIFGDSGLRVRAIGEGDEGVDLESLERGMRETGEEDRGVEVCLGVARDINQGRHET